MSIIVFPIDSSVKPNRSNRVRIQDYVVVYDPDARPSESKSVRMRLPYGAVTVRERTF